MDVELFLEGQAKWEADSPHCLMMLYEMFHHATDEGQKEAEQTVHRGHWKELLKLDPEVDLSTIQLVIPHTSKEELQSLYLEVYKQWRLPGSPPGEPELMVEVVSSFDDHQVQKQRRAPETVAQYPSMDVQPSRNCTPERGEEGIFSRKESSQCEESPPKSTGHGSSLGGRNTMTQLPPTRSKPGVRIHSRSRDHWIHESRGQKRRCHHMQPESCPPPYFKYNPSRRNSESGREVMATEDPDLVEPPELELGVTSFLRGLAENSEEEEEWPPPELPVQELHKWVMWKAKMCKTPDWWRELLAVPGVPNCKKLVWKMWALFHHPKRISEVNRMENYYQAPLHNRVSSERTFNHLQILSSPAKTFGTCRERRQWHTPMPSSIGCRRLIHLLEDNHTCWLRVWRSYGKRWGATSPSQTRKFLKV